MSVDIKVPEFPESVAEGTVSAWNFKVGDHIEAGAVIAEIETDKVVMEVPAVTSGVLDKIAKQEGETVLGQEIIGAMDDHAKAPAAAKAPEDTPEASAKAPAAKEDASQVAMSPSVRRLIAEHGLDASLIKGSGKEGRVVKQDVMAFLESNPSQSSAPEAKSEPVAVADLAGQRLEKRVAMTRLRQTVAKRLLAVQHESAILTTFNEVDMKPVMDLRTKYKETFEKTHGVRLGFMSFFLKATIEALKKFPAVNASIDGQDMVYHGYFDIGVAVSSPRGLVVPVVRNADQLSFAEIEAQVKGYGQKAKEGKLSLDELQGGTFTITNGGVFGSMLSTPIINQPQSAILGMHNIVQRPVVVDGEICIRPIMYLALSYDHRIIDGSESVQFLRTIKERIEDPARMFLQV